MNPGYRLFWDMEQVCMPRGFVIIRKLIKQRITYCWHMARLCRHYREGSYGGQIGMALNLNGLIPASDSEEDRAATQRVHDETHALFLDPIYNGTYPQALFEYIGPHQPKVQDRRRADYLTSRLISLV